MRLWLPASPRTQSSKTRATLTSGREAIRRWQEVTRAKWEYTVTATGGRPDADGEYVVLAHLSGNFPGAEAHVEYRFALRGDLIARLRID